MVRKLTLLLLSLLLCPQPAFPQTEHAPEWLNERVLVSSESHHQTGTLCLIDFPNGRQWMAVAGLANKEQNVPALGNYYVEIGSMTKMFIATAILQLHEDSLLNIYKPFTSYIQEPWAKNLNRWKKKNWSDSISILNMLNHTAGIFDYLDDGTDQATVDKYGYEGKVRFKPRELIRNSNIEGSYGPPNKKWHYSNTAYLALGILIETVSGKPWQDYIQEHILDPANLQRTKFGTRMNKEELSKKMQGYFDGKKINMAFSLAGASGEMVSTLPDMAVFIRKWWGGEFFKYPETTNLLRTAHFADIGPLGSYGMGIMHLMDLYGHGGQTFGFSGFGGILPQKEIVLIWIQNDSQVGVYPAILDISDELMEKKKKPVSGEK
ncbi:serine hydrolase [Persicobacter sp. CCB-QB2]|uniref:serine hydrolase domain-containing protein n=1 Tax=Persicobacter sp. CCB-QB2 TaxID=1561025 RepID=UPI0006A97A47|nr:serine hydrolase domain-containing protein [Persicobacter sp. CCB-QB2]